MVKDDFKYFLFGLATTTGLTGILTACEANQNGFKSGSKLAITFLKPDGGTGLPTEIMVKIPAGTEGWVQANGAIKQKAIDMFEFDDGVKGKVTGKGRLEYAHENAMPVPQDGSAPEWLALVLLAYGFLGQYFE